MEGTGKAVQYSVKWEQLLSPQRSRESSRKYVRSTDLRSEFEKDYHLLLAVLLLGGYRIRRRYFLWIKVILSERD